MAEEPTNADAVAPDAEAAVPESAAPAQDEATRAASSSGTAPSPPAEVLPPKERRARARALKAANTDARPPRTPEERQQERDADRRAKAQRRHTDRLRDRAKAAASSSETHATPPREHAPGVQKIRQGVVVSDRADKTITVRIDVARRHRRYEKIVRTSNTLHAHDERNDAHVGDTVIVRESRPLSRSKRWRLIQVVERAK